MIVMTNCFLIAVAIVGLLYYVVTANGLAAQAWRLADAQGQLSSQLETRNGLIAQQAELEDRSVLTTLANSQGMVPSGAVVYLVQNQSVAVR